MAVTPNQHMAKQYVVGLSLENLVISGHSKGGNMAEALAYMLPEGMVHKTLSYDGHRQTTFFLDIIPEHHKTAAAKKAKSINEYRDIVSPLFRQNMDQSNTFYFDSKEDYSLKVTEGKMYGRIFVPVSKYGAFDFALYHKPNLFLKEKSEIIKYNPGLFGQITDNIVDSLMNAEGISGLITGGLKLGMPGGWTFLEYSASLEADNLYQKMHEKRSLNLQNHIYARLPPLFSNNHLKDSEVLLSLIPI